MRAFSQEGHSPIFYSSGKVFVNSTTHLAPFQPTITRKETGSFITRNYQFVTEKPGIKRHLKDMI